MSDDQVNAFCTAERASLRGWQLLACLWMARQARREIALEKTSAKQRSHLVIVEHHWMSRAYSLLDEMEADLPEVVARLETLGRDMDDLDGVPPGGPSGGAPGEDSAA